MGFIRGFNRVGITFFAIIFILGFIIRCSSERNEALTIKQIQSEIRFMNYHNGQAS